MRLLYTSVYKIILNISMGLPRQKSIIFRRHAARQVDTGVLSLIHGIDRPIYMENLE